MDPKLFIQLFGILAIIGGLGGILRKRFVGEGITYKGNNAVIIGSFFLLIGITLMIITMI